ncbi:MAG: DUF479 domain-containing protein [Pseudomonadales bacterium]|nr:DUF479 domain-containing protein [Pseudomonadales bacterium]
MNYLAHLYLAKITQTSQIGNFLGDFVRGRIENIELPKPYILGIQLHRKIDIFTDTHPTVFNSRNRISKQRRRYAGIIIDMAYDHFLAKNWLDYSNVFLGVFVQQFYDDLQNNIENLPENSQKIVPYIVEGNWLENYQHIKGVSYGINGISQRMFRRFNRENNLWGASEEITLNFDELYNDFTSFFPELVKYVKQLSQQSTRDSV